MQTPRISAPFGANIAKKKKTALAVVFFFFDWDGTSGLFYVAKAGSHTEGITKRSGVILSFRPKKSYHFDTTFFIHYGVMAYHHALACIKLRNDDIQCSALMIYSSKSEIYSFSDG